MAKILLALRSSKEPLMLVDIIRKCEGLPERYYYLGVLLDNVWLSKCPNLQTSFASCQPDFHGRSIGWPMATAWDNEVKKLYVSYYRSVKRLLEWDLIEGRWNPVKRTRVRYTISMKRINDLNVKKNARQLPEQKPPRLKAFCPRCLAKRHRVILEPCSDGSRWRCTECSFILPLEKPKSMC